MVAVDLVISTFERNRDKVMRPGFFPMIEASNQFKFARRILLINNVTDAAASAIAAEELVRSGEIDTWHFVADGLDRALALTAVSRSEFNFVEPYLTYLLVAVTLPSSEWFVHWDADVTLLEHRNWIEPSLELLGADPRLICANPAWWRGSAEAEAREFSGDFALGYGFSDHVFLGSQRDFARPIYSEPPCPASLRYPLAHVGKIFEQRMDTHMRRHGRLRATYLNATYTHPDNEGQSYPRVGPALRLLQLRNRLLARVLQRIPITDPRWRI